MDVEEDWDCEARPLLFWNRGKYGVQVQNLLKAASALEIEKICPLHGPVLNAKIWSIIWDSIRPGLLTALSQKVL